MFPGITSKISGRTRTWSQHVWFQRLCLQPLNYNTSTDASNIVSDNNLDEGYALCVIGFTCFTDLSTAGHILFEFHISCKSTREPQWPD